MKYIELTIHTTTEASEIISDIMWNYTDYGVTICDREDIIALQTAKESTFWDYMDDELTDNKPSDVLVKCYVAEDIAGETLLAILRDVQDAKERSEGFVPFGTLEDTKRTVDGDDWIDVWKKHFRPIHLGQIVVVPEWIDYAPATREHVVLLDSNMAFGTGEHETTSMCVELMQEYRLDENDMMRLNEFGEIDDMMNNAINDVIQVVDTSQSEADQPDELHTFGI
jgi:ribosomal protein L11 methyltransferase